MEGASGVSQKLAYKRPIQRVKDIGREPSAPPAAKGDAAAGGGALRPPCLPRPVQISKPSPSPPAPAKAAPARGGRGVKEKDVKK